MAKDKKLTEAQEQHARALYAESGIDIRTVRNYLLGKPVMRASKILIEQAHAKLTAKV
jgi:hypothetical protein